MWHWKGLDLARLNEQRTRIAKEGEKRSTTEFPGALAVLKREREGIRKWFDLIWFLMFKTYFSARRRTTATKTRRRRRRRKKEEKTRACHGNKDTKEIHRFQKEKIKNIVLDGKSIEMQQNVCLWLQYFPCFWYFLHFSVQIAFGQHGGGLPVTTKLVERRNNLILAALLIATERERERESDYNYKE